MTLEQLSSASQIVAAIGVIASLVYLGAVRQSGSANALRASSKKAIAICFGPTWANYYVESQSAISMAI